MKLSTIIDCHRILTSMKQNYYPSSMMYTLIHNVRMLTPVVEDFNKAKNAIIEKYANRDEEGNIIETDKGVTIPVKVRAEFQNELDSLLDTDTDITFDKVDKDSLKLCGTGNYNSLNMEQLMMIEDYMM